MQVIFLWSADYELQILDLFLLSSASRMLDCTRVCNDCLFFFSWILTAELIKYATSKDIIVSLGHHVSILVYHYVSMFDSSSSLCIDVSSLFTVCHSINSVTYAFSLTACLHGNNGRGLPRGSINDHTPRKWSE